MQQSTPFKYSPINGKPCVNAMTNFREDYPGATWAFNPWTGERRGVTDVMSDPTGLLIVPPGEPVFAATKATDTQVGGNHYRDMKIQPVEFIHANGITYIEGAVIKYVCRWRTKNGVEDLKKARHFLDLLIQLEGAK